MMDPETSSAGSGGGARARVVPLLEVSDLKKHFPVGRRILGQPTRLVYAVDGISLAIGHGETLGLVGESGCGKSTAGKSILKLIEPTSGTIRLAGRDITHLSKAAMGPLRREMQIIFQDPYSSLNPRLTAGAIVGEPLTIHRIARRGEKRERVEGLFERVGLRASDMRKFPKEFSGGQRQRIGIARALSLNPKLIIGDEPVSALDASIRAQVINLVMDLQAELGLSYLFISHDLAVVEHVSHRIAVMYLGRIVELATKQDLFTSPLHPYTEALLSAVPIPDTRVKRSGRIVLTGDVPSPIAPPSGCHFHTRCPRAMDQCKVVGPELRQIQPGHWAACHLHTEPAAKS